MGVSGSFLNGMEWHLESLPVSTQKGLKYLAKQEWIKNTNWYLAGGTALALQEGHRKSVDLDFFTTDKEFDELALTEKFKNGVWQPESVEPNTVYGKIEGAKSSFIEAEWPKVKSVILKEATLVTKRLLDLL